MWVVVFRGTGSHRYQFTVEAENREEAISLGRITAKINYPAIRRWSLVSVVPAS